MTKQPKEINKEKLEKINKAEKTQLKLTNYITSFGKWILLVFPILLVVITILSIFIFPQVPNATSFWEQNLDYQILTIIYLIILAVYFFNSIILLLGAFKTSQSLRLRLEFERERGRPIDSLDGFKMLFNNVTKVVNLLKIIAVVCIISVILFVIMFWLGDLTLGVTAMASALVGVGLALLVKSLNLRIHDVNGLQDFFKPTTHEIFLDNLFAEIVTNHLDPVTFLKWDEFVIGLTEILQPTFIEKVKAQEEDELPITFALERLLFLYYLHYQNVLPREQLDQEFKEVVKVDDKKFDIEKGLFLEGNWFFSASDIYKLFEFIKKHNPGFFNIIDRLQLELADNIIRVAKDPIYMDSATQELVYNNGELNIMVFLYNNFPKEETYQIRIEAPGFEPNHILLKIDVEGRGSFIIPDHQIPLTSDKGEDIVGVLSNMLENGDTAWVTLEPRQKGEQTIQIFLETEDGVIIEGKTRSIVVSQNRKENLKKITSLLSVLSGFAIAAARIIPSLL
jgi:hypothetical protein